MATYVPAKKGTAYVFGIGLISQSNTKFMQSNPTLAAGDVKVSIDGGAFNNLVSLPTVAPAAGKRVQVSLSAAEMNGDNITVAFSDVSGAEWCDLVVNIQTTARQIDDLAFPNTSGRGMDVDASGGVEVGSFQANAITAAAVATDAVTEIQAGLATSANQGAIAAAIADLPTSAEFASALAALPAANLAAAFEGAETVQDFMRLARAALYGLNNGMGTDTGHFRDKANAKDRITVTQDSAGNRSALTLDPS